MTIAQTVRDAQDTLARLPSSELKRYLSDYNLRFNKRCGNDEFGLMYLAPQEAIAPPQSLGELCLELARERMYYKTTWVTPDGLGVGVGYYYRPSVRQDMKALRAAMYHRNTDPEKVARTLKAEKWRNCYAYSGKTGSSGSNRMESRGHPRITNV